MQTTKTRKPEVLSLIKKMYLEDKFPAWRIAEELKIGRVTVLRRLKELGITRTGSQASRNRIIKPYKLTDDKVNEIIKLYVCEKLSTTEIAGRVGVSQCTIWEKLSNVGIIRSYSEAANNYWKNDNVDIDLLKEKYLNEKKSILDIANEMNISWWVAYTRIQKLNLDKRANVRIGCCPSEETINKLRIISKNFWANSENKEKQSIMCKELWQIPEFVEKQRLGHKNDKWWKKNECERKLEILINLVSSDYVFYGELKYGHLCGGIPDFVDIKHKKIIQHNGCYYHACILCRPEVNREAYGQLKSNVQIEIDNNKRYADNRWSVLVIWEHDLLSYPDKVLERIKEFIK